MTIVIIGNLRSASEFNHRKDWNAQLLLTQGKQTIMLIHNVRYDEGENEIIMMSAYPPQQS